MLTTPVCPVCANTCLELIGEATYRQSDSSVLTPYIKKRYRVLFEVWFRSQQAVTITSQLCTACGFVLYAPRPEAPDLDAKYRFLGALEPDVRTAPDAPIEQSRARQHYRAVSKLARQTPQRARVLDFGGGDGRLMCQFLAAGCECDVVDYAAQTVTGVQKRGDTLADLPPSERYNWIICSHVLEHVADPLQIVQTLSGHLAEDGVLYIEVPMEIWGRAPLQEEPVTHVNFFTPGSLRYLMQRAGLEVIRVRLGAYLHPSGRYLLAVRAIAQRVSMSTGSLTPPGNTETRRFLHPGLRERIWRYALAPQNISTAIRYKVRRLFKRK